MILTDYTPLEEAAPKDKDTFRARLISPGWGSSGYYSPETLREAAHLYRAGLKMYLNHPTVTERKELPERDVSKIAGYLVTNATYESGTHPGLYAHIKVLPKYLDLVRHMGRLVGLSHYAEGQSKVGIAEGRRGSIVEKITRVVSVDLVTEPGRGGRICEAGRYINPTEDDGSQEYYESLVKGGMSEHAATVVLSSLLKKPFSPAPVRVSEAETMLIQTYVESGMREDTARKLVLGL